jgi:predicted amidophosphoribosyltransferase
MRIIRTIPVDRQQPAVSRQRRWQVGKVAAGFCARCGAAREHYAQLCDGCAAKERVAKRVRHGHKPHERGRRGRPPLIKTR